MFQTNDAIALILSFENFVGYLRQTNQPLQNKITTKFLEIISQQPIKINNENKVCKNIFDFVLSKECSIESLCKKGLFIRMFFLTKKQKDLYIVSDFASHAKNINKHFSVMNNLNEFREMQSIVIEGKFLEEDSVIPPTVASLQLDMPKEPSAPKIVRYGFEEKEPDNLYANVVADPEPEDEPEHVVAKNNSGILIIPDDAPFEKDMNDALLSSEEREQYEDELALQAEEEGEIYDAEFMDENTSIIPFQDVNQPVIYGVNGSPDSEQLRMIRSNGRCLIAAGAGSGKTASVINRIKELIDSGVHPSRIMATTFNSKAIFELKERLIKKIGFETMKLMRVGTMHSLLATLVKQYGTSVEKQAMTSGFMASGGSVFGLAEELYKCSGLEKIHGVPNSKRVRLHMTSWRGNGITPTQAMEIAKKTNSKAFFISAKIYEFYEGVKGAIPGWKINVESKRYTNFMAKYRSVNKRLADFDDQLIMANDILKRNPQAKLAVQQSIDHMFIDEAQDVNGVQKEVFDQITEHIDESKGQSFHMIGDLSQCVYAFRSARPELFFEVAKNPKFKVLSIRTNYRCPPEIVEMSNRLIENNTLRMDILALPNPSRKYGEGSIVLENPIDDATAAIQSVHKIKNGLAQGKNLHDYAVLTRTNKELHVFETACIVNNIPYGRNNASSFLGSPETRAFIGYIELLLGKDNIKKQQAFRDVINNPLRFFVNNELLEKAIDDTFAKFARKNKINIEDVDPMEILSNRYECEIFAYALNNDAHGFKVKKDIQRLNDLSNNLYMIGSFLKEPNFSTRDLFAEILRLRGISTEVVDGKTCYEEKSFSELLVIQIKKAPGEDDLDEDLEDEELLGNIQFLFELAKPNPVDEEDAKDSPETPMGFYHKIERYQLKTKELRIDLREWSKKQNALNEDERSPLPGIYLGTAHSTKGSEWSDVYLQVPKHIFPYESFPRPGEPEKTPAELQSELESERRLCYVGMTRARNTLTVLCPSIVGNREAGISQFVVEAGLQIGENVNKQ